MRLRLHSLPTPLVLLSLAACSGNQTPDRRVTTEDSAGIEADRPVSIRFAIEIGSAEVGPIYVNLTDPDGQPGWIRVSRDGERVFFRERCEIEDCGRSPVVCGAALETVVDIAALNDRSIALQWDGMTSVVRVVEGCEIREPATPGEYLARFCYSRQAEMTERGEPSQPSVGRLIDPECTERTFRLRDSEVVVEF